jgi:uncharacterized lipoprotein YmbA
MNSLKSFLLMCIVLLSGCNIKHRSPAEIHHFLLNVQRPEVETTRSTDACLQIRPCRMATAFADRSLVYRTGPVRYEQDYYNLFLTNPRDQITDILQLWFLRAGFSECIPGSASDTLRYILDTQVDTFCADFSAAKPVAVVQMAVTVTRYDKQTSQRTSVLEKVFIRRVLLPPDPAAADVVEGLSQALTQILQQLEGEIAGLM